MNGLHERSLLIVCSDNRSYFEDLLHKYKNVSIHVRNAQTLSLEMFKAVKNLRNPSTFVYLRFTVFLHSMESISYFCPKIWKMIPLEIKKLTRKIAFNREVQI